MDAEINEGTVAREIAADQRKQNDRLRSDGKLMQQLLAHPGWPRYLSMIEAVSQGQLVAIMRPLDNSTEFPKIEHAKGTLNGLSLAAQLPSAKIREALDLLGASSLDAE